MADVQVRPVRQEDCAGIAAFRLRMEGGGYLASIRDAAFYERKYLHWGWALVLEEDGRIAGTVAAIPKRVRVGGEIVRAADIGDLFIDPGLRGHGLFRRLHDDLVGILEADGVSMLTVRPGPGSEPLLRRAFGYRTLFPVREWVAALDDEGARVLPLGRLRPARMFLPRVGEAGPAAGPGTPCGPGLAEGLDAPEPFGGSWPGAGTVRDAAWLRERYTADPTPYETTVLEEDGRVAGVAVHLVLEGRAGAPARGWIVDGWTGSSDGSAALPLAACAIAELRSAGASLVHFWSAHGPPRGRDALADALRRLGLRGVSRGARVLYRPLGDGPPPQLPGPAAWMFRIGDTDGI